EICRPGRQPRWASVRQVLVDSGSEMTWLPERLLRSIGIDVFKRDQHFVMANGLEITRDVGIAVIRSGDFKTVDEVVFGRAGDLRVLAVAQLSPEHTAGTVPLHDDPVDPHRTEPPQVRLDVLHESPRDTTPAAGPVHGQPVHVTAPPVPAADQAADQSTAIPREDEQAPVSVELPAQGVRIVGDARLGGGAAP